MLTCQVLAVIAACEKKADWGTRVAVDPDGFRTIHPRHRQGLE